MADVQEQRESNGSNDKLPGGITGKGFSKGVSGNPGGRRRGSVSLTAALRRELTRADAQKIARKLIDLAIAGDLQAAKLLFDRGDSIAIEERITALETFVQTQTERENRWHR